MVRRTASYMIGLTSLLWLSAQTHADDVPPKPVDGTIRWLYSYEAGKQMARETGRPMFVVFRCER